MIRSPLLYLDVAHLLERLEIKAKHRAGARVYEAPCPSPDHKDRSPSWFIRDQPGEDFHACHKCLSCGFAGGPVALVGAVLGWAYWDVDLAKAWLLDGQARRPVPDVVRLVVEPPRRKWGVAWPKGANFWPLDEWPAGARKYVEGRALERWQVDYWGLGFVPASVDTPYAGRVVVPFRNAAGDLRSWTARSWSKTDSKKYLEPSREHHPDPNAIFGEARWPELETDVGVVVEGSFDGLAVERAMDSEVGVAVFAGSSPTPSQINRVAARFKRVVVFRDPGEAGEGMARFVRSALGRDVESVAVVGHPEHDAGKLGETSAGLGQIRAMIEGALDHG